MNSDYFDEDINMVGWKELSVDDYKNKIDLIDTYKDDFIKLRNYISIDEYKDNIGKDVYLWVDNIYGLEECNAKLVDVGDNYISVDKYGDKYDIKLCDIKEGEFLLDKAIELDLNTEYIAKITNIYDKSIKVIVMLEGSEGDSDDSLGICYIDKNTMKFGYTYYPTRLIKNIEIIEKVSI